MGFNIWNARTASRYFSLFAHPQHARNWKSAAQRRLAWKSWDYVRAALGYWQYYQASATTLHVSSDARLLFDLVTDCFQSVQTMREQLCAAAKIAGNPNFESTLVEAQDGYEHRLISTENNTMQHHLDSAYRFRRAGLQEKDLADDFIKRHRPASEPTTSRYVDTRFIVSTSNTCYLHLMNWYFFTLTSQFGISLMCMASFSK